jgi:glycosyltransferase involved in cell wall biosynthesis
MPEPISIVHFLRRIRLEEGGVVQAVVDLCQAFSARGHQVTLVTCDASDVPQAWKENNDGEPRVVEIEESALTTRLISKRGLKVFRELLAGVDLVHLHTPWELGNLQIMPLLRARKIPYIVTVHGMLDDWSMQQKTLKKRTFLKLFGRKLFKYATTVHLTAKGECEQASRWVPIEDRWAIQCYALDLTSYDPLPGPNPALKAFPQIRPEKKKILFLSRLHPKKGIEFLLQAGAILRDRGVPVQLLIAGPGDEHYTKKLKRLTSRLGMEDHTEFLGMVRGIEKRSLFQLSDVFALPTYQENFGLVIAEAMACGTPVVTTRGTDIWREIMEAGARIADMNPESLASELHEFLKDGQACEAVGQQGLRFIRQWLDRSNVTSGYEKMYRDTIARGAALQ